MTWETPTPHQPGLAELTPERIDQIVDQQRDHDHAPPPWLEPLADLIADKLAERLGRGGGDCAP